MLSSRRLGMFKKDSSRLIKVTLASTDSMKQVLSEATTLKTVRDDRAEWRKIYLAPDRNREERLTHEKLVAEMKQLLNRKRA